MGLSEGLLPIDQGEAATAVGKFLGGGGERMGVVLVDGVTLTGEVRPAGSDEELGLLVRETRKIVVPWAQVAGLYPADFDQVVEEHYPGEDVTGAEFAALDAALDAEALRSAAEHEFAVVEVPPAQSPSLPPGVLAIHVSRVKRYGRWKAPRGFSPLYCDWDFFSRRAGGLRGIGIGLFGFSGEGSGDPSLLRDVYLELTAEAKDRWTVCQEPQGVVEGFISPVTSVGIDGVDRLELEMEGAAWRAMVIRDAPPSGGANGPSGSWSLGYFATDSRVGLPFYLWPGSGEPIRFFGEVLRHEAMTDFGSVQCLLKVRAAANLQRGPKPR